MLHQQNEIIAERYRITGTLGIGGMGSTYAAFDLSNSQPVALKAISLRQTSDWKILELFEREAKVLASINHPFIPDYLDYFELDTKSDRRFYLVQELVAGKSLAESIAFGWHPNEAEVKDIAVRLLKILVYLHARTPSIIHRDIKPQNIIRRTDGKVYLVDFGAVQDVYRHNSNIDSTLVGTLGYISWEQVQGKVVPASDLYSLGCCLLFLLTRKSPAELPRAKTELDLSSQTSITPDFEIWLRKMVEPMPENRFKSADEALQALEAKSKASQAIVNPAIAKSNKSRITIYRQANCLRYRIPLGSYRSTRENKLASGISRATIAILGLFVVPEITVVGICVWLFYLGSFPQKSRSSRLAKASANTLQKYISLEINSETFCLEQTVGVSKSGMVNIDTQSGKTSEISWFDRLGEKGDRLVLATRQNNQERQYVFGEEYLSPEEAEMIVRQIEEFLRTKS